MLAISLTLAAVLGIATVWPDLPFGKGVARLGMKVLSAFTSTGLQARAIVAIGAALLLYAAVSVLAGDAPMVLAMILPELTVWFATFEVMTLVEAMVGIGTVVAAARAAGVQRYFAARFRARRSRRAARPARKPANDDEPGAMPLAA